MAVRKMRVRRCLAAVATFAAVIAVPGPAPADASGPVSVEVRVSSGADDVEESDTGSMYISSSDLELVYGGTAGDQIVGIRFNGVAIPQGARIDDAHVQFQTDETSSDPTNLIIRAEASDDAAPFGSDDWNVSSRATTSSSVEWAPTAWETTGEAGPDQRTPSLASLIQETVDRPGWLSGNSIVLIIEGTGERVAEAYDGDQTGAPLLHVDYSAGVSVEAVDDTATEGASPSDQGVFRLSRPGPFDEALTVDYSIGGTATSGSDYVGLSGSAEIPIGEAWVDVVVDALDDAETEGSETVVLTVLDGVGYSAGTSDTAVVTIFDDETPTVSIAVTDELAVEGADPANDAVFTITRTGPTDQALVVEYATGGDATSGSDYAALSGSVDILSGSSSANVVVSPLDDIFSEPSETLTISVVPGTGYAVGEPSTAVATIIDNDPIQNVRIGSSSDDAEESPNGSVDLTSSDLELIHDLMEGDQTVGLRFVLDASPGTTITSAWVQFQANEIDTEPASLVIEGEAIDDAPAFADVPLGISSRSRTVQSVSWSPPAWPTKRDAGPDQQTPDLSPIFQEIVDRPGWAAGNAVALIITGTGRRVADAFDADPGAAPVLHIEYSGTGTPSNSPPEVRASADSVIYPNAADLDGTVSDDRLPDPPGSVAVTWSMVSGPGTVTFGNANAVDTTASFSEPGVYELQLTASDGELSSSDTVLLTAVDPNTEPPSRIRAVAFGDYGVGCCAEADVANMVETLSPDIIITTGDNRYINDIDYAVGQFYAGYIGNYQGSYGLGSPINRFFPAPGNHDHSEVGGIDVYLDYFSLPGGAIETTGTSGNERYYDFVYGPVHFFAINSDHAEPDGRTSSSAQAQWLQERLAASQSPWQIVYMHHPPYSTGGSHGSQPELQWPYESWGADAVLAGHDHLYERILEGSFPYFVIGNGGAGIYPANSNSVPGSQFIYDADHGAMVIDACSTSLTFEFHSVSGGLLDSHTLGTPGCGALSPPTAGDDNDTTSEDNPVDTVVTANDTDPDGDLDPSTVAIATAPSVGTATPKEDGTVTYAPDPDANGTDTYVYEVCDTGGLCDTATVTITVDPVPDPPVAVDDSATTTEDTGVDIDVAANDSDVDGDLDPTTVSVTTQGTKGSAAPVGDGTVTYTPNAGATGTDAFTYEICDATALCATASVAVSIGAVNDPPTALDDSVQTDEDVPATFDAAGNDSDADGAIVRASTNTACSGCSETANGILTNHGDGTFSYSPDIDFNGSDGFAYEICDDGGLCDTATVTITVDAVPDPPVADDDSATTTEDTAVTIDVLANDTDAEGDIDGSTLQVTVPASNGSTVIEIDDTITYIPDSGTSGLDSFTYQVCDTTSLCDTAAVSVTVDTSTTVVDQYAQFETTVVGNTSGSLDDTSSADGVHEEIIEAHSGGPPPNRQSFAEHRWVFNIRRGDSIEVSARAYHTANDESDDFRFDYSTDDGQTFLPLFTVTGSDNPGLYTAALPEVISGEVIIRAVDTDQTPGNGNTDTLFVDHLVISTTNPQAPLPNVTVTAPDDSAAESGDTATFLFSRDDPTGSLTVDFTVGGTADEVDDFAALGTSIDFVDGQSAVTLTVTPVDDLVSEGDESVELSLDAGTTYQRGADSVATVSIIDDDVVGSEARAISETSGSGMVVSGDYTSTHFANDAVAEVIEEELYAGNKRSRLEHTWTFDVGPGSNVTFYLLADHEGSETFTFSYSTDGGGSWAAMSVSASGSPESATLSGSVQGTVLVRVTDDDRSRNEATIDRVLIDEMYFLSSP